MEILVAALSSRTHSVCLTIIIWWDESESDGVLADNADNFDHTIGEIVISPRAHQNVNGLPYASRLNYTHSSDLQTMQEIFRVGPLLDDAVTAIDLSALFDPGAVPKKPKCLVYEWLGKAQNSPPCIPARRAER